MQLRTNIYIYMIVHDVYIDFLKKINVQCE